MKTEKTHSFLNEFEYARIWKRVKNSEWRGFIVTGVHTFFIPFVSWFYLGYEIKITKSETLYLKYKSKKKTKKKE